MTIKTNHKAKTAKWFDAGTYQTVKHMSPVCPKTYIIGPLAKYQALIGRQYVEIKKNANQSLSLKSYLLEVLVKMLL